MSDCACVCEAALFRLGTSRELQRTPVLSTDHTSNDVIHSTVNCTSSILPSSNYVSAYFPFSFPLVRPDPWPSEYVDVQGNLSCRSTQGRARLNRLSHRRPALVRQVGCQWSAWCSPPLLPNTVRRPSELDLQIEGENQSKTKTKVQTHDTTPPGPACFLLYNPG